MESGAKSKGKGAKPPTYFTKRTLRVVRAQSSVSRVCSRFMTPSTRRRRGLEKSTPARNANKRRTEGRRKRERRIHPGSHPNQGKKGEEGKLTTEGRGKRNEEGGERAGTKAGAGIQLTPNF